MSGLPAPSPKQQGYSYIIRVLVAIDMAANVVIGGSPDETISARAGRLRYLYPWTWGVLAAVLNWIQPNHVEKAIIDDAKRAGRVVEVEEKAEEEGL